MGAPFDMSQMQAMLSDPEVKNMIEQMQSDPSFMAMTQQVQSAMASGGGLGALANMFPGMMPPGAGGAEGAADGAPAGADAAATRDAGAAAGVLPGAAPGPEYMNAMQSMFQNPEFAKVAEKIGSKMMQSDPNMKAMLEKMQDPDMQADLKKRIEAMKADPEAGELLQELEAGGPTAMAAMWNDPAKLERLGKAFNNMPGGMPDFLGAMGGGPAAGGAAGEEEDEDDDEEPVDSEFLQAAMDGDVDKVKQMIADADKGFNIDEQDPTGHSALHFACGYGELDIVKCLLENKASVTGVDADKNTPLHYAAGYGKLECAKLLLEHGAGLTDKNNDGKTAFEVAEMNEQAEIAALLKNEEGDAFL